MLASLQRGHPKVEVREDRGGNDDGVHTGVRQKVAVIPGRSGARVSTRDFRKAVRMQVRHMSDPAVGLIGKIANKIRPPVAVSDDTDRDHSPALLFRSRAGTPATTASSGTSRVTTAPAPMTAR